MAFNFTYIIIAINVLVFLATSNKPEWVHRMLLLPYRVIHNKEYDRLFLSGFAHSGIMHLAFNMLTLYYFGPVIEMAIGSTLYLLVFLASIVGGNLYCMLMRKEDKMYAALGASGGVLGIMYAVIMILPDAKLYLFFIPFGIPGWIFGILFTIGSITLTQLPRAQEARISHEGHLGGALIGGIFMLAYLGIAQLTHQQWYFIWGGILPLILFAAIKLIAPKLIYRHLQ